MTMRSDLHQLSGKARALCYAIEKLPASEQQTTLSVQAAALASGIRQVAENMIASTSWGEESPNESVVCGACGTEFITAKLHGECPGCKSKLKAVTGGPILADVMCRGCGHGEDIHGPEGCGAASPDGFCECRGFDRLDVYALGTSTGRAPVSRAARSTKVKPTNNEEK